MPGDGRWIAISERDGKIMAKLRRFTSRSCTRLASSSSDNSPAFQRWVSMAKNLKSLQGRQNRVDSMVLLSSLKGLKYRYDTIFQTLKRGAIVSEQTR